jgi:hypothetical protein
MNLKTHLKLIFLILLLVTLYKSQKCDNNYCEYSNFFLKNKRPIYDNTTIFTIQNTMPESYTYTILSPECMFIGNYTEHDCKSYTNIYLDLNCKFYQEKNITDHNGNPNYYLYLSPQVYYRYDARLNIYNNTEYNHIHLAPGLSCQSNNICVYVVSFTLSYKNWQDVPIDGNNVVLNCSKFSIYSYL